MAPRKNTAHRPSQAHLEFVTTKDGRRVRNTAFTGKAGKTSKPSATSVAPKSATAPAAGSEAEEIVTSALSHLSPGRGNDGLAEMVKEGTSVTSSDGSVSAAKFVKPVRVYASSGRHYNVESVHVVDDLSDGDAAVASLAESFESVKVKKGRKGTSPSRVAGRSKRLVVTPKGEYVVDSGTWTSPLNGSEIATSSTVALDNDDWVNNGHTERGDSAGLARLMAEEVARTERER